MTKALYAAIDLGGTKIYTVLADHAGNILAHVRLDTLAQSGPDTVMGQMVQSVQDVYTKAKTSGTIKAVGVCAAGFFDWKKRVLIQSPNIPGWVNIPLEECLSHLLAVPVMVENDANAAALGEARLGAGKGCHDVIFVTVSTGVGAGLILNNQIYRGSAGFAGEIGHMVVKPNGPLCGCGRYGCLEAMASGTAIARMVTEAVERGATTLLAQTTTISAEHVFEAVRQGDKVAQQVVEEAIHYLGIGLVNMINLLNPEVVVIGGGVSEAGDDLFLPLRRIIAQHAIPAAANVSLKKATLGVEAGVLGMLCLLREQHLEQ